MGNGRWCRWRECWRGPAGGDVGMGRDDFFGGGGGA